MNSVYVGGVANYSSLTVDVRRKKLYYTDDGGTIGIVGELTTDGTNHRQLIIESNSRPRSIVIDVDHR